MSRMAFRNGDFTNAVDVQNAIDLGTEANSGFLAFSAAWSFIRKTIVAGTFA